MDSRRREMSSLSEEGGFSDEEVSEGDAPEGEGTDVTGGEEIGELGETEGTPGEEAFEQLHKIRMSAPIPNVVFIFAKPCFMTRHSFSKRLPRLYRRGAGAQLF